MKNTKVTIDGTVIKNTDSGSDPKKVISWEYNKTDQEISEAEIIVPRNIDTLIDLTNGQTVQIEAGWTTATDRRFFYGYIDDLEPEGATIKIVCKNNMGNLVRKNVNKIYDSSIDASAGEISEIAKDLIETYGGMTASVQSSGTEEGRKIDTFKCINADVFERLQALKRALNWDLYYDDDADVVHFEPKGYSESGINITAGNEIVGVPKWKQDTTEIINDLRVEGATVQTEITESGQIGTDAGYTTSEIELNKTPDVTELYLDENDPPTTQREGGNTSNTDAYYWTDRENKKILPSDSTGSFPDGNYAQINYIWSSPAPIHMRNQESIDNYGLSEKTIYLNDISSISDAESRGKEILSEKAEPRNSGKMQVKSTSTTIPQRGQIVNITDNISPSISGSSFTGDYVVAKIKYKFPSAVEEIEVGEEERTLNSWIQTIEERLKRIEENDVRNQDLLTELREFSDRIDTVEPRYRRIYTKAYTTADNTLIWDNTDHGLWDTDNWATTANPDGFDDEVVEFCQQYEDTYEENFIDEDFKNSTNTTASWSTTGSVTFTSGQIAESLSVDYNNGTINSAKLTSTEESGSFTYEMTADGTNWESVTSGTEHTFSNTGTDLRWRATENNSSTGEINDIKIENYH
ncbi:MAG: hypothetical protein ACOC5T_08330 [Elusimicrobiota bacterium]